MPPLTLRAVTHPDPTTSSFNIINEAAPPEPRASSIALLSELNPLTDPWPATPPPSLPLILRTGWSEDPDAPAWLPRSRSRFEAFTDAAAKSGATVWLWPRAANVLSDVPSIVSFFREREGERFGLVFDPVALLTGKMHDDVIEHLERSFEALRGHPGVRVVVRRELSGVDAFARGEVEKFWSELSSLQPRAWLLSISDGAEGGSDDHGSSRQRD